MNDFDDMLTSSLDERAAGISGATGDLADVHRRVRRHAVVRRSVVGACAGVLTLGMVAVIAARSPGEAPSAAEAVDDSETAPVGEAAGSCADGQIRSEEGDLVVRAGGAYRIEPGQCLTVTEMEPGAIEIGGCGMIVGMTGAEPLAPPVTTSIVSGPGAIEVEPCTSIGAACLSWTGLVTYDYGTGTLPTVTLPPIPATAVPSDGVGLEPCVTTCTVEGSEDTAVATEAYTCTTEAGSVSVVPATTTTSVG